MVLVFLANGFEEIEALTPVDLLRREKIDCKTVGIGSKEIVGSHGIKVEADMLDKEALKLLDDPNFDLEMIVLPGGMPGTTNLAESSVVDRFINAANRKDAYIAAICAAPTILGKLGLLEGKMATCYPGMENDLIGAEKYTCDVILDQNIITARGMGVATEFALQIVECLKDEATAEKLREKIIA